MHKIKLYLKTIKQLRQTETREFLRIKWFSADPNLISDFEEDNDTGYTALHFAARFNNYQCIQLLIDHGADIQVESTNRNYTPYVIAIRFKAMVSEI